MSAGMHGDTPCPFPDEECITCLLKLEDPERHQKIRHALQNLPSAHEETIERWTTTIKTFTKALNPNQDTPSPELDYLVENCGLLSSLLNVAFKVRKPYSPDYALDIIARYLATPGSEGNERYIEELMGEDLFFKISGILVDCEVSTVRGSAMDVLSAIFGTSWAAGKLAEKDPETFQDLVQMLIVVGETTPEQIVSELTSVDDFDEEEEEGEEEEAEGAADDRSDGDSVSKMKSETGRLKDVAHSKEREGNDDVDSVSRVNPETGPLEDPEDDRSGEEDGDSKVNRSLYQLDILNISYSEIDDYSDRWAEIIRDRAMMALSSMMRSLCASGGRHGEHPILAQFLHTPGILDFLSNSIREELPASFPETDRPLEAAVCFALLCSAGEPTAKQLVSENAVQFVGQAILFLLSENAEEVMDLFYELEKYLPAHLVLENLSELADMAVSNRSLQLAALVHALSSLCKYCPESCETAAPIFRRLLQIGLGQKEIIGNNNTPSIIRGLNPCIQDQQIRKIFLARGIRVGDRYTSVLYCPTVMDSACLGLYRLRDEVTLSKLRSEISLRAEELRYMGNTDFTAKKYQSARDYYGLAYELADCTRDPERCCLSLTNRAECNLQLGQWIGACEDAEKSLLLCKPSHSHFQKTTSRRERALKHLEGKEGRVEVEVE